MDRPMRRLDLRLLTAILLVPPAFLAANVLGAGYPPKPGKAHSPLVLPTLEGDKVIALSSLRGKKVLVIHFASWSAKCRKELPVWYQKAKPLVAEGKLAVLAVAHEQHADRCRLFAQWKGIDWPILHDPLNLINVETLPLVVAVDEHGIVRSTDLQPDDLAKKFIQEEFERPDELPPPGPAELTDTRITRRVAKDSRSIKGWRDHGDALVLAGAPVQINEAIDAYRQGLKQKKGDVDARTYFRLGVAHRLRHDRPEHQDGDFQAAVDAWRKAVELAPDNAVFAARLRQYAPTVGKPHAYFDWVETAVKEIITRGQTPIKLAVEPCATERGQSTETSPNKEKPKAGDGAPASPQPDKDNLVEVEKTVVRSADEKAVGVVEVQLTFRPDPGRAVRWDDATGGLSARIEPQEGAKVAAASVKYAPLPDPVLENARTLSFDVQLPKRHGEAVAMTVHAIYAVRQGESGPPSLLSRDISVKIANTDADVPSPRPGLIR
jgi:thiol-disulfide isomerase/thioredoxin